MCSGGIAMCLLSSLFHCAFTDKQPLHTYRPVGENSWCGYKRDQANKISTYKHGKGLPLSDIVEHKPVYAHCSNDNRLQKCLDAKT